MVLAVKMGRERRIREERLGMRDEGLGMRDERLGMRDQR